MNAEVIELGAVKKRRCSFCLEEPVEPNKLIGGDGKPTICFECAKLANEKLKESK